MATTTPQQTAINVYNQLILFAQQLQTARQTMDAINHMVTDFNPAFYLQQMATAVVNADGNIRAADGTPNGAHPITVQGLYRSYNLFLGGERLLADFAAFCTANDSASTPHNTNIDDLVG